MIRIFSIFLLLSALSCSSQKKSTPPAEEATTLPRIISETFGSNFQQIANESKEYTLYTQTVKKGEGQFIQVNFMVIKNDTQEVLITESLQEGNVSWQSAFEILIERTPKVLPSPDQKDQNKQVFNVKQKRIINSNYTNGSY